MPNSLSFRDKQAIKQPVTVLANWFDPNNASSYGNTQYTLETAVEEDEGVSIHTLSLSTYIATKSTAKEEQITQIRDITGKKLVNAVANKKFDAFYLKLIGQYTIAVDHTNDVYVITKEDWESVAATPLTDKRGRVVKVTSLTYETDYKDIVVKSHQDVFAAMLDLNNKAIYKNPTISLLLRLIEYGDSNYSVVFLEWFEEQFMNEGTENHAAFGNNYLRQYEAYKAKEEQLQFVTLSEGDPEIAN